MNNIILHLGSNQGLRHQYLLRARHLLAERIGVEVASSACYETSAWGVEDQRAFLNIALYFQTLLSPHAVLEEVLEIENELGRTRERKWGERCIDIDIMFFEDHIIKEERLTLPHPWMQERRFVLVPLADIIADWVHPVLGRTVKQLLEQCTDEGMVVRVN